MPGVLGGRALGRATLARRLPGAGGRAGRRSAGPVERDDVVEEGERLLSFLAPDRAHDVRVGG
ncbi:hypothetical protein [Blastococcus litoris]|uniref:hypothetical protein n=1 Tax=Blastococcus litoris TaxID=2171622 RepID=UPI000E301F4D|nr:hypothetical protein [Blastococcus litoris]